MTGKKKRLLLAGAAAVLLSVSSLLLFSWILKYSCETAQHNMRGASGNVVCIHVDGHQEAVFDAAGKLVTDDANKASYNYGDPGRQPLRHFLLDTVPWIILGNTRNDPTTFGERFGTWTRDLKDGAKVAFGLAPVRRPSASPEDRQPAPRTK